MMNLVKPTLVCFIALLTTTAFASTDLVDYFVEAESIYIDKAGKPNLSLIAPGDSTLTPSDDGRRTLGLNFMKLGLSATVNNAVSIQMVLRPDSGIDGRGGVELDSRAGEPYRAATPVKLLDLYEMSFRVGEGLGISSGVYESLAIRGSVYRQPLRFGLETVLPEKFAGMMLSMVRSYGDDGDSSKGFEIDLVGFQGARDRAEVAGYEPRTYDRGPESDDPYWGVGLRSRYRPASGIEVGAVVATVDDKLIEGLRNELWTQVTTKVDLLQVTLKPSIAMDFRYAKEKWRSDAFDVADRTQQSVSLTGTFLIFPDIWLLSGLHTGRSERAYSDTVTDKVRPFSGNQFDIGLTNKVGEYLEVGGQYSQETRIRERDDGGEEGGFLEIGSSKRQLKRMALFINYTIGR